MQEQLITFETALMADAAEFMNGSLFYFDHQCESIDNKGAVYINGLSNGLYEQPTQSLLQKWLREVHNIHVQPYADDFINDPAKILYSVNLPQFEITVEDFETYEDALEVGLQEALKLIK